MSRKATLFFLSFVLIQIPFLAYGQSDTFQEYCTRLNGRKLNIEGASNDTKVALDLPKIESLPDKHANIPRGLFRKVVSKHCQLDIVLEDINARNTERKKLVIDPGMTVSRKLMKCEKNSQGKEEFVQTYDMVRGNTLSVILEKMELRCSVDGKINEAKGKLPFQFIELTDPSMPPRPDEIHVQGKDKSKGTASLDAGEIPHPMDLKWKKLQRAFVKASSFTA